MCRDDGLVKHLALVFPTVLGGVGNTPEAEIKVEEAKELCTRYGVELVDPTGAGKPDRTTAANNKEPAAYESRPGISNVASPQQSEQSRPGSPTPLYLGPKRLSSKAGFLQGCGKMKALVVGISYQGDDEPLEAPLHDVDDVVSWLTDCYDIDGQDILTLTDKPANDPSRLPTRSNILNSFEWLLNGVVEGSSLVFYFSGHATQQRDVDGDETKGFDQALKPLDYKDGLLLDDQMYEALAKRIPRGAQLTVIFDTCHSGSLMDLPFTYTPQRIGRNLNDPSAGAILEVSLRNVPGQVIRSHVMVSHY
ncbi:hypothetical protein M427DRAFT_102104 [Gonapodya prolifera JEL478]|uniref:Peptidase C14 caspase domain-containing protein n=1 Tax=Gonapodya prolifera (strain JEL478) TaxID=1344416 RepID=A0A139A4P8_GONPJ|nr:hypothetical protein M427DRAFT_102104 [Gonapodya prolifera JEL478]|eukprot:KXS11750.1 hypothetical protein M427DRAFT_102104 [Gonapodya prolifera JEL478]